MVNYGKIIANKIKVQKAKIQNIQSSTEKYKDELKDIINSFVNANNFDVKEFTRKVKKCNDIIEKFENEILFIEDNIINLYTILYSDNNVERLIDSIVNFMVYLDTYNFKKDYDDIYDYKEYITLLLFIDNRKIIDSLNSYKDKVNDGDIQCIDSFIKQIIRLFD